MKKSVSSDEYEKPKRKNRLFDYVHIQYIHIYICVREGSFVISRAILTKLFFTNNNSFEFSTPRYATLW